MTRAGITAILVFWAVSALYFVQPFTGSFALVAIPAALLAALAFAVLLRAPPTPKDDP